MAISREGFTIDVVVSFLRRTLLNPAILFLIPVPWAYAYAKPYLSDDIALPQILQPTSLWLVAFRVCQALTLCLWANDYLNDGFANNWVDDSTWDWNKEIVLITGGSSGIGARVVQLLLKKNMKTTIVVVDYSPLSWTPPPGANVHYYQGDLSNSNTIKTISARIRKEVGNPTVLINNAGLVRGATVMDGSYADVEVTIRTNLIAPFLLIKEFLPYMVKQNHGHIINTGSMSSVLPPATIADYAATKSGLNALHEVRTHPLIPRK